MKQVLLGKPNYKMSTEIIDLNSHALSWIGKIHYDFGFIVQQAFKSEGLDLTKEQWSVLKRLRVNDGQPQNDLAFITHRDKTSMTRLINAMEANELVVRRKDAKDRRVNRVYLTKHGKDVIEKVLPIMYDLIPAVQQTLTKEEIETLVKTLMKIKTRIETLADDEVVSKLL